MIYPLIIFLLFTLSLITSPLIAAQKPEKRTWTIITYMAADNNLGPFARKNLKEQEKGDYPSLYRFVHLDIKISGNKKITKQYLIENEQLIIKNDPNQYPMDSGSPDTLIQCCKNAIEQCPADFYVLIIWDHGSGPLDFYWQSSRIVPNPYLSFINPLTNLIELNRELTFSDYLATKINHERGICFDDTTGHYITNQGLDYALKTICHTCLNGNKFDIIGIDACFMASLEIASILKSYASVMIASEEIEWATGWRYDLVFAPFAHQNLDTTTFAHHIINVYNATYKHITNDYTLSAIDLEKISLLEKSIDTIATLLTDCLKRQQHYSVTRALQSSSHKLSCTVFYEPSYIDLSHFLTNVSVQLKNFSLTDASLEKELISTLEQEINTAQTLIAQAVFANTVGKNLENARGISIYFPHNTMHFSYGNNKFSLSNNWFVLLNQYLKSKNIMQQKS